MLKLTEVYRFKLVLELQPE